MKKLVVITCPKCGAEYLPCEIFVPNQFFGKPLYIEKDNNGKILDVIGSDIDYTETYECDRCNTHFNINTKLSFNVTISDNVDFNSDYERNF